MTKLTTARLLAVFREKARNDFDDEFRLVDFIYESQEVRRKDIVDRYNSASDDFKDDVADDWYFHGTDSRILRALGLIRIHVGIDGFVTSLHRHLASRPKHERAPWWSTLMDYFKDHWSIEMSLLQYYPDVNAVRVLGNAFKHSMPPRLTAKDLGDIGPQFVHAAELAEGEEIPYEKFDLQDLAERSNTFKYALVDRLVSVDMQRSGIR